MKLSNMGNVLRDAGLTVVETDGWAERGFLGQDLIDVRQVYWHHTATNRSAFERSNAPTLQLCIDGRSDLAGPLCHIVLGRDGTCYLVAAGLANHAGAGYAYGIPVDAGNWYAIGIEMESSGVAPFDWTEDQLRVAPHLGAALERAYLDDQPEEEQIQLGHLEYSSQGKIDPAGWPGGMDGLRASINELLGAPPQSAPVPVTPDAPPAAASEDTWTPYCTVDAGDTLWSIARQFGKTVDLLLAYNPGIDVNALQPGQRIELLDHCRVEAGDTLSSIADQFKIPLARIIECNPGIDPDRIVPDQVIYLQ